MECGTKKHTGNRWRILPLVVLICGIIILHAIVAEINRMEYEKTRTKASLNAVTYADRMIHNLNLGAGIASSIEQLLISENGVVNKFSTIASGMMSDYVQSIQLAPDGVVNEIYPEEGNEAGKIDLVNDEKRGAIVRYGIENDIVVMHGPFTLNQGGVGIAIRKPVYLYNEDGERYFWGLAIVIIKAPEIFNDSVIYVIYTGDLGQVGSELMCELFRRDGTEISHKHKDCGLMLYDREKQDVHAGGSGCGCSASVLCGHILPQIAEGKLHRVLFAATGALMSTTKVQQGESIPGISHLVEISDAL